MAAAVSGFSWGFLCDHRVFLCIGGCVAGCPCHVCVTVSVDSLCRVELPHVLLCLGHVCGGQAGSCMVGEGLSSRNLGGIQSLYSACSPPSFLPCLREE